MKTIITKKRKKHKNKRKILAVILLWFFNILLFLSLAVSCALTLANIKEGMITNDIESSSSVAIISNSSPNQIKLVGVEVFKLPNSTSYTAVDTISTLGGELRIVFSDYSVKYVPMNDSMIDVSRIKTSNIGTSKVFIKYSFNQDTLFTSYDINIVPFKIKPSNLKLDIIYSDVLIDQIVKLNYIIEPINSTYSKVIWKSSNPEIAEVDSEGVVTPKKVGEVTITASSDELSSTAKLNIIEIIKPIIIEEVQIVQQPLPVGNRYINIGDRLGYDLASSDVVILNFVQKFDITQPDWNLNNQNPTRINVMLDFFRTRVFNNNSIDKANITSNVFIFNASPGDYYLYTEKNDASATDPMIAIFNSNPSDFQIGNNNSNVIAFNDDYDEIYGYFPNDPEYGELIANNSLSNTNPNPLSPFNSAIKFSISTSGVYYFIVLDWGNNIGNGFVNLRSILP